MIMYGIGFHGSYCGTLHLLLEATAQPFLWLSTSTAYPFSIVALKPRWKLYIIWFFFIPLPIF